MTSPNRPILQWFRPHADSFRETTCAVIEAGVLVVWKRLPVSTRGYPKRGYFIVHLKSHQTAQETFELDVPDWFELGRAPTKFETRRAAQKAAERWYKETYPFEYLTRAVNESTPSDRKLKSRKQYGI